MRKILMLSYAALLFIFSMALYVHKKSAPVPTPTAPAAIVLPLRAEVPAPTPSPAPLPDIQDGEDAPEVINVLCDGDACLTDMQAYLVRVVAAEMPADFHPEALKAQAVAARTYAIYCADSRRHGDADICTDSACCQAWTGDEALAKNWGADFERNLAKITEAVEATHGEYLCYDGKAVFAAFHSSSAGFTEDCGAIWSSVPYLLSVDSPETPDTVPGLVSGLEISALDFRDTLLHDRAEADFTGEERAWVQSLERDDSGRVSRAMIGGAEFSGTRLRSLFNLRSTNFTLEYTGRGFLFTVYGFGHGVGMSQHGANLMAESGADYREILAHYYPGTVLVK